MSELFNESEVYMKSPRLLWIERNQPRTRHDMAGWTAWFMGNDNAKGDGPENRKMAGYGNTEDDALAELAQIYRIPLWNHTQFAP